MVSTYRVTASERLTIVGSRTTGGIGTSRLSFDPVRNLLFAPNTGSGSVTVFQVDRQAAVLTQAVGSPVPTTASPVAAVLHPSLAVAYVLNTPGQIDVFGIGASGVLTHVGPTLTNPFAQIHSATVSADGRFLFVVSGDAGVSGQITAYSLDATSGALVRQVNTSQPTSGTNSRSMLLSSTNGGPVLYTTNADSASVSAFHVDAATGALTPVLGSPFTTGSQPGPLVAVGNFMFVVERGSLNVRRFAINPDGSLTFQTVIPLTSAPVGDDVAVVPSQNLVFVGGGAQLTPAVLQVSPSTGAAQNVFGPATAQAASVGVAAAEAP